MALPLVGAVIAGAKSGAVSSAIEGIGDGLSSLFGGKTDTDRRREEHARELLTSALNGSADAVRQLQYEAFEKREGKPGDVRRPVDRKYSPDDVRSLAKKMLQAYYTQTRTTPPAQYATQLNVAVPDKPAPIGTQLLDRVTQPVLTAVGDAVADEAAERARANAGKIVLYGLGIVAIFALAVTVTTRTSKAAA
jgi:hypothetical protein